MKLNRVVKNASWIIVCKVIQSVLAFVIGTLSARYLHPSGYGKLNYAASVVSFVAPIMYLGFNSTLVRELVKDPDHQGEIMGSAIGSSIISAILCMLGANAFVFISNKGDTETIVVCALYSTLLLFQAIDLIKYWFQSKLLSKYTSVAALGAYMVMAGYKILLLVTKKSVYWFAAASSIESLVIAIALIISYLLIGKKRLRFSFKRAGSMLKRSGFFIISNMMITIFAHTDRIMLKHMIGDEATGIYSAAVTLAVITSFVFTAIIDSASPVILESTEEIPRFEKNMTRTYCIVIYLSLLQSVAMTLLAKPMVLLTFGAGFTDSIRVLRLVVWYTTFSYCGGVRSVWILAKNYQKYIWRINLAGALMNVALNFALIPFMGIMGAALASILSQFFTNVIMGYIIRPFRPCNALMVKSLAPGNIVDLIRIIRGKADRLQ